MEDPSVSVLTKAFAWMLPATKSPPITNETGKNAFFQRLPIELRYEIYNFLFESKTFHFPRFWDPKDLRRAASDEDDIKPLVAIGWLLTCKQAYVSVHLSPRHFVLLQH